MSPGYRWAPALDIPACPSLCPRPRPSPSEQADSWPWELSQSGGLRPHREASVATLPSCASSPRAPLLSHPLRLSYSAVPSSGESSTVSSPCFLPLPSWKVPRMLGLWGHSLLLLYPGTALPRIHTHQNEEDSGLTSGLRLGHGIRSSLLSLTSSFPRLRAHPPWQACSKTFYSYCSCQMHLGRLP